ncbi:MAG TPA: hypothetical protein VFH15_08935 [Pyrinomonadaceae bacterium]|nr:hypothetical protein [Pyrinomonadaceae bacterium]
MKIKFPDSTTSAKASRLPLIVMVTVLLVSAACTAPESIQPGESSSGTPFPTASPKSAFERDLQFIRNGNFTYVWVFSRADGKPLDRDDANFLRQSAPQVIDWVTTDDGKRVIGGTNFDLEQGGMPALRKRFVVEDYTGK